MANNEWQIRRPTLDLLDTLDSQREAITDTLNALRESLDTEVTTMSYAWDDKSDHWKEGDRGTTVQDWLDSWRTFTNEVESAASALEDVETPPNDSPEF